jgi:hypothetical protein
MDIGARFLRETTLRFRQEYLPRLERALAPLDATDVWWRPHPETTSIGILVRHLEGNIRQWILSGLGGAPDRRIREVEFGGDGQPTPAELLERLQTTTEAVCRFLDAFDPARLGDPYRIQGFGTTAMGAVYHVLEHYGWHLGQITWIAKLRAGPAHGIAFYDDDALDAARNDSRGPTEE